MLTSNDIERTFFSLVKGSVLGQSVGGSVYRSNMRPPYSREEDIVVMFVAGLDSQIQTGVVLVNIYTKPIRYNGADVDDKNRCASLLRLFYDMLEEGEVTTGHILETDGTPRVNYDDITKQYVISGRIRYKWLNI